MSLEKVRSIQTNDDQNTIEIITEKLQQEDVSRLMRSLSTVFEGIGRGISIAIVIFSISVSIAISAITFIYLADQLEEKKIILNKEK